MAHGGGVWECDSGDGDQTSQTQSLKGVEHTDVSNVNKQSLESEI